MVETSQIVQDAAKWAGLTLDKQTVTFVVSQVSAIVSSMLLLPQFYPYHPSLCFPY